MQIKLQKPMRFAVYSTLSLGAVDLAFSLTRFVAVQTSNVGDVRSFTTIELWSALDMMVGLIVTCLPSLRPLLRRNFDASSASNSRETNSHLVQVSQDTTLTNTPMTINLTRRWMAQEAVTEINGLEARISDESGDG